MSKKLFLGADRFIFQHAKTLRNTPTEAENLLWGFLKGNQLGCRFRRQHPLGIYTADFYCHQHKLVVELDGSIHNLLEVKANDMQKEAYLKREGLIILRFSNQQIFEQTEFVLDKIKSRFNSPFRGSGGIL